MNIFKNIKQKAQNTGKVLLPLVKQYLDVNPEEQEIIIKPQATLFLCKQVQGKVEKIKSLKPDEKKGLIADIEHNSINITIHFNPECITLKEDCIQGQIKLINKPDIKTDSKVYNTLIAGWKVFLGGYIPQSALPENVKVEGDKVFYTFPRNQLKTLEALLKGVKNESVFNTDINEGQFTIKSNVSLDWNNIDIQAFLSSFNSK
ncbi:hypothetical protein A5482_015200 (plasmid) [Cyanobacterium sp. IPPAS B-1200]|uniref:hypothetical protein n=1 Tax=Cyanobacterium sp. IPPAS B-1200 TaxID=1562720 RepID=UPI00085285EC|nr:hypothetical protein [Cyanobacterium sp. IPPAS B-1200]OEJ78452.1 hypothetical protein A5482_13200 [Cyanobacterium sp. IPPAS B-1200]